MDDWQEEILKKWQKNAPVANVVTDTLRDRLAREFRGEVSYREPMDRHTTMRVGGMADVFLKPSSLEDLQAATKIAREEKVPLFFLGFGSNVLVKDGGIRGMVLTPSGALQKYSIQKEEDTYADVLAEAGAHLTAFVYFCRDQSLTGLESLVGIPGSIGGAISMNAGARGVEIKDMLREICVMDEEGSSSILPIEKCEFSYRHLKLPRRFLIVSGLFRLEKARQEEIAARIKEFQKMRTESQPLNYPNLGSIFKNPLPQKGKGETQSSAPTAGQLIEETGLKGIRVGGARISEKHANFIVNENKATAKDVMVLISLVRDKVKEKTGILLETEIRIIGEEGN